MPDDEQRRTRMMPETRLSVSHSDKTVRAGSGCPPFVISLCFPFYGLIILTLLVNIQLSHYFRTDSMEDFGTPHDEPIRSTTLIPSKLHLKQKLQTSPQKNQEQMEEDRTKENDEDNETIRIGGGVCPRNPTTVGGATLRSRTQKPHNTDYSLADSLKLQFVHIRKTGGTAIKKTGKHHRINWQLVVPSLPRNTTYIQMILGRGRLGNRYHLPPSLFDPYPYHNLQPLQLYSAPNTTTRSTDVPTIPHALGNNNASPVKGIPTTIPTFVVVRDPYERILSEYYQAFKGICAKKWKQPIFLKHFQTVPGFNTTALATALVPLLGGVDGNRRCGKTDEDTIINNVTVMNDSIQLFLRYPTGDIFIPQYYYVYNQQQQHHFSQHPNTTATTSSTINDRIQAQLQPQKLITHVLKFHNLSSEFQELMECYYPLSNIRLPTSQSNPRQTNTQLTKDNLTTATIQQIHQYMYYDFVLFDYPMM